MAERGRLRDVARGRKVPINAPQAPVTTTASVATPAAAAPGKRVQVTLEAHPLTATTPAKAPEQDDASATATKHASTSELGA
jgi:hypothetical protein